MNHSFVSESDYGRHIELSRFVRRGTIYACQERQGDAKAGVKSTAVIFGDYGKPILSIFATIFVTSLVYAGLVTGPGQGWIYYSISVGGCAADLLWQLATLNTEDPQDCWNEFDSNGYIGYIVLAGQLDG